MSWRQFSHIEFTNSNEGATSLIENYMAEINFSAIYIAKKAY